MDTDVENVFYVFGEYRTYMKFTMCQNTSLYMYVIEEESEVLIHSTVAGESNKFFNIDQAQAKAVRELQEVLASPSDYDLANAVENSVVGTTPFTRRNIRIATIIHGHDVAALKGKTNKKPSEMPNANEVRDIPSHIVKNYLKVNLYIDVMHVNGIMLLVGVSRHIGLIQCVCIRNKVL